MSGGAEPGPPVRVGAKKARRSWPDIIAQGGIRRTSHASIHLDRVRRRRREERFRGAAGAAERCCGDTRSGAAGKGQEHIRPDPKGAVHHSRKAPCAAEPRCLGLGMVVLRV